MTLYLPDLEAWCEEDIPGGTEGRVEEGVAALFETADASTVRHDAVIHKVVRECGGEVVAETSQGLFCRFDDPVKACLAAVNLKRAARLLGVDARAALTFGQIPAEAPALRNPTARRCLRVFAIALPGQILIDGNLGETLGRKAEGFPELLLSEPVPVDLKESGPVTLLELTTREQGYSAPVEEHVPMIGDVEISPVQNARFPDEPDPARYLACDTCGKTMSPEGDDGMMVIEREGDTIKKFHLFHKGDCDVLKNQSWRDLHEFANPECYLQFVIALMNNWSARQLKIEDSGGLVRLLMGMYRSVFRKTTNKEHLNFIGVMQLMHLIGE